MLNIRAWLFGLGVSILAGCTAVSTDAFYLENVGPSESAAQLFRRVKQPVAEEKIPIDFYLAAHRFAPGAGSAVALREYFETPFLTIDQGGYRKVTIWLPDAIVAPNEIDVSANPDVVALVTVGNPSFPNQGCWAYAKSGKIKIIAKDEDAVQLTVDLQFGKLMPDCTDYRMVWSTTVELKKLEDLSPWEGREGVTIYEEGVRR